jgi:hypothetical protein
MGTVGNDVSGGRKNAKIKMQKSKIKRSAFHFGGLSGGQSKQARNFFPVTFVPGRGIFRQG